MEKLTDVEYWNAIYEDKPMPADAPESSRLKKALKRFFRDYANGYLLREKLIPSYIPRGILKTIEVGCAPGGNLVYFHKELGHDVYGVEYTPAGVNATRRRFAKEGIDPSHIIEADFFDDAFLATHRGQYDVVYSKGFIEHFDDTKAVVQRHVELLRPGGYLVLLIPNLSGMNRQLANFFDRGTLAIHNTSIMRLQAFRSLFDPGMLEEIRCGYVGVFHFGLFTTDGPLAQRIHRVCLTIQFALNALFRLAFRTHGPESGGMSPYLLYIGKKR